MTRSRFTAAIVFLLATPGLTQSKDGVIAGRCTDARGKPVAKAKVDLFVRDYSWHRTRLVRSAMTNESGGFSFADIPAMAEADYGFRFYYVVVQAKGHAVGYRTLRSKSTPWQKLEIPMRKPASLAGVIRDLAGKPIPHARVFVVGLGEFKDGADQLYLSEPNPVLLKLTDAKGRFQLTNLPAGIRLRVRADSPMHAAETVPVAAPYSGELQLSPAGIVTGRVLLPDGTPARQVLVGCQGAKGQATGFTSTRTDDKGEYRLTSLREGSYNIWAKAEGWTMTALANFGTEARKTLKAPDLRLVKGGFIVGRIVDVATGKGVRTHVMADVGLHGPSRPRGGGIEVARVNDDGTFRIRAAPGRNYVYFRAYDASWSSGKGVYVDVAEGKTVEVEFETRRHQKAAGRRR